MNWRLLSKLKRWCQLNWLVHLVLPIQLASMCKKGEGTPIGLTPLCIA